MILISVLNLKEDKIAKLAARLSGCQFYKSSSNMKQFETSISNIHSARKLATFFRLRGYQVTSEHIIQT